MLIKRLAGNFGATLYEQIVNVIIQAASVPLFLAFWSKERYGAWILVSSIPVYLTLGEAGFATSSANEASMAIAQGNRHRALRALHTAWGFLVGIATLLLVLTLAAFFVIPWDAWLKLSEVTAGEVRWTILLLSLYSIIAILIGIFGTIYRASYKFPRNHVANTTGRLGELLAVGLALSLTKSMICVAAAMLIARCITFAALFFDSRNLSTDFNLGLAGFSFVELGRMWRPSVMFMANTMGNAIYIQGLTLLVGVTLGAAAVVVFNTTRTLTRVVVQFATMIRICIWLEFSYLFGEGDMTRARGLNQLAIEVSAIGSMFLAGAIFFAASWVMPAWTHHVVRSDPVLLAILLCSAVLNACWSVTSSLLMGTNQHEGFTMRYISAAALTILLAAISVPRLGLHGVALSMVACECLVLPYVVSRTCQLLHQPLKDLVMNSIQLRMVRQISAAYYHRWLGNRG